MSNFRKICDKQELLLEYDKNLNIYSLLFNIKNINNNNTNKILSSNNIYKILKELNEDIIEDIIEIYCNNNENTILFIFKLIGGEAGLKQKYMFLNNYKSIESNRYIFNSKSISKETLLEKNILNETIFNKISKLQEITCEFATLNIDFNDNNLIKMHYIFKIILMDSLPSYLNNITGLLMKKVFLRLKNYIENNKL